MRTFLIGLVLTLTACNSGGLPSRGTVQAAVERSLDKFELKGSISVIGIREPGPKTDGTLVDLQFDSFQYNANNLRGTALPKDYKAPALPDIHASNYYDKLYAYSTGQSHVATYTGKGMALLNRPGIAGGELV